MVVGLFGGYLIQRARAEAKVAGPARTAEALRESRIRDFASLPDGACVVMLGDSLTAGGPWSELLGIVIANRGVGGDTAANVLERLDRSVPPTSRQAFLMVGINDLTGVESVESIALTIDEIVTRLAPREVVLQSVVLTDRAELNEKVEALNRINRARCEKGGCRYLDVNAVLAEGGRIAPALTVDGVHLQGEAYARWARLVAPAIEAGPCNP